MANTTLFRSLIGALIPRADAQEERGHVFHVSALAAVHGRLGDELRRVPFEHSVVALHLSPRDSVMTNAERLASVGGGGTCVSAPLAQLNARNAKGDVVVLSLIHI